MDTFELLPSLAQGQLSETSAPELVAAVFRSRASGTLWLETARGAEVRIFFRAGDMCGSAPFEGFQTLAHVLLANDWVGAIDIDTSREEAAASGKRHGEVLISRGLLTPEQLRSALVAQHTTNLNLVLNLTEGRYDWRGSEPPPAWAREVVVDPVACLVGALEQEQHAARRSKIIAWLGDHPARLSLDWPDMQARVALEAMDRRAAALLALPRRLGEFVQASRLEQTRAEALLAALLLAGGVEPQPAGGGPARVEEPVLEPIPEAALQGEESFSASRFAGSRGESAVVNESEAIARLESLELDEIGASAAAPAEEEELEIDHQRLAAGRDAGPHPQLSRDEVVFEADPAAGLNPSAGSDEGRSRDMRKKMLARGLRNMGAPPQHGRTEREGAVEEAPPARTVIDSSKLAGEDRLFADEVRVRVHRAPTQTAYVRLAVAPGATNEQIKNAYLQAAKRFHPDRASGALAPLLTDLQMLFGLFKEAYELIATPEARTAYEQSLKAGGGKAAAPSRKEEASMSLKMGEVLLKKRDFEGAIGKLRRAVDLDATGDALAALAWGLVCDPKATAATKEEAASLINRALRAPGVTARTFYVAGVLWRTKDPDSAVDAFRKALELDPHHPDAALELRLIEQRRGKQQKTGGGVLSGLLFGKRKS